MGLLLGPNYESLGALAGPSPVPTRAWARSDTEDRGIGDSLSLSGQ